MNIADFAWTINAKGEIWTVKPQGGAELMAPQNFAAEISIGADATVWVISPDPQPDQSGNIIKWYDVVAKQWQTVPAPAAAVKAVMNHDLTPPPTLSNTGEAWVKLPQTATFQSFWDSTNKYDSTQSTHLWIVCRAAEVARSQQPQGQKIYDLVKPAAQRGQDTFHDGICEGLWDADEADPYRNSVAEGDTW